MDSPNHENELELLQTIVGEKLSSVEFVADYVQLRFDGSTLSAFTQPTIVVGNRESSWNDPGYRDALFCRIGHTVKSVSIRPGNYIEVVFDDGVASRISLEDSSYRGAEAAKFDSVSGEWWVI